ncbi:MAG TPA: AAA family ATPase, partial [Burkholderiaceae bacterium]
RVLFLDEPTAGVDVELRHDMWQMVRELRENGVTIILTTHYIEEAEEMADRIGVIAKGRLLLVEDKTELMRKLGRKQVTLMLPQALAEVPAALHDYELALSPDGHQLTYTYDTRNESRGIVDFIRHVNDAGVQYTDLQTKQSSLEEIFVSLVEGERDRPARPPEGRMPPLGGQARSAGGAR